LGRVWPLGEVRYSASDNLMNVRRFKRAAEILHRSALLRRVAKRVARNLTLTQPFHGGSIAFNAVAHSWAWTGTRNYENFDRELQDRLLALSFDRPHFIDIGANVGAMTLSVLLRNPEARAIAVEPGAEAVALLRHSLRLNGLGGRCEVINVAASAEESFLTFDSAGSVMGHVSPGGQSVRAVGIMDIVRQSETTKPILLKIDVEGFERSLVPAMKGVLAPAGSSAVIELHPFGFNGLGDPQFCFEQLKAQSRFEIRALGGAPIDRVDPGAFTQIEVNCL